MGRGETVPVDGACWGRRPRRATHLGSCRRGAIVQSSSSLLLGFAHAERGGGSRGRSALGQQRVRGGGVVSGLTERRGGGKEEGGAGAVFLRACVTVMLAWAQVASTTSVVAPAFLWAPKNYGWVCCALVFIFCVTIVI